MPRTPPPALRAVRVPALVGRLVAVVSAVVVEIAPPKFRDAFAVVARELLRFIFLYRVLSLPFMRYSVQ